MASDASKKKRTKEELGELARNAFEIVSHHSKRRATDYEREMRALSRLQNEVLMKKLEFDREMLSHIYPDQGVESWHEDDVGAELNRHQRRLIRDRGYDGAHFEMNDLENKASRELTRRHRLSKDYLDSLHNLQSTTRKKANELDNRFPWARTAGQFDQIVRTADNLESYVPVQMLQELASLREVEEE